MPGPDTWGDALSSCSTRSRAALGTIPAAARQRAQQEMGSVDTLVIAPQRQLLRAP